MTGNLNSDFVPLGLAVFCIAYTITQLHGPFGLAKKLRAAICEKCLPSRDGEVCKCEHDWEWVREGLTCPICCGFWVSLCFLPCYSLTTCLAAWGVTAVIWMSWKASEKRTDAIEERTAAVERRTERMLDRKNSGSVFVD